MTARTFSKDKLLKDEDLKLDGKNRDHFRDQEKKDALLKVNIWAIYWFPVIALFCLAGYVWIDPQKGIQMTLGIILGSVGSWVYGNK